MRNNWSVHPVAYTYWEKKEQFLLEYDTYPVWTIFAVEQGQFAYRFGDHEGEAGWGISSYVRRVRPFTGER